MDSATNHFTLAQALQIQLVEELWDAHPDENGNNVPDPAEELVPLQSVAKDPKVKNATGIDAWVFLEVSVPTYDTVVVEEDGTLSESASRELFSYEANEGWLEMGTATYDAENNVTVHRYAWTEGLAGNASTSTLFDSVTLVNLADNQLDALAENGTVALNIEVEAIGIQKEGFDTYTAGWDAFAAQTSRS